MFLACVFQADLPLQTCIASRVHIGAGTRDQGTSIDSSSAETTQYSGDADLWST